MDYEQDRDVVVSWVIDRRPWVDSVFEDKTLYKTSEYNSKIIFLCEPVKIAEEQYECCICTESREKEDACALNCGHMCCATCINIIAELPRVFCCPFCRGVVTSVRSHSAKLYITF